MDDGLDVNEKDEKGITIFMKEPDNPDIEVVKLFLKAGVDVNERDK